MFDESRRHKSTNILDQWIISANQSLLEYFRTEMDGYRLSTIVKGLLAFLDDLTKWYIRLNRSRIRGDAGEEEMQQSLNTLFDVLLSTTQMMCCFTPFISEFMYLNLRNGLPESVRRDSIHFLQIPQVDKSLIESDEDSSVKSVEHMRQIIELARLIRD